MKRWHMEGIVSTGHVVHKLQIPRPGQKTLWSASAEERARNEFFLTRVMRVMRERVQRSS